MNQKRILVADDDYRLCIALAKRLETAGYVVFTAHTGMDALLAAIDHKPDLIILDVNMPMGSGLSVQDRLTKNMYGYRNCPIIVISGEDREWLEETAYTHGAAYFIRKPFDHTELIEAVNGALEFYNPTG